MEANIVVLVDYELQQIRLFGRVNKTVGFSDAFLLPILLKDSEVIYIKDADVVSGDSVVEFVNQLCPPEENPEKRYIHATVDGYTKVQDIGITFAGPRDAKPMDKLGNVFDRSPKMRELLIEGKVEVITETVAKALKKPLPGKNLRDKVYDDMLLNKSVEAFQNEEDDMWKDDSNVISGDEADKIETEAETMIKKGYGKRE
jgi:hypothetical protein